MNKFFVIIFLCTYAISQEFQITNSNNINVHPTTDPFTHEIYYMEDWTGNIMKIKPDGSGNTLTIFPSLPTFSDKEHKAFYLEFIPTIRTNLIQYDFNTGDATLLSTHTNLPVIDIYLSPNEEKLLFKGAAPVYFSFIDSIVHDPGIRINAESVEWINDSTLIYVDSDRERILKYSYYDNNIDTLITTTISEGIVDIACNPDSNIFVYSHFFNNGDDIGINLFRVTTQIDSMVFDFNHDDPQLAGLIILLNDLEWSPQYDKLAFIGNVLSPNVGEIYVYDINMDTTIRFTDFGLTDDGLKYDLIWFNEDTILYDCKKYMQLSQIYGFDIKTPLYIHQNSNISHTLFLLSNFPNPFNYRTAFQIRLPFSGYTTIYIYNSVGQSINKMNLGFLIEGVHSFHWEVQNQYRRHISSGIYFCVAKLYNGKDFYYSNLIKLIYVK